jgi:CAP-Gly domain-containing linker protein 1
MSGRMTPSSMLLKSESRITASSTGRITPSNGGRATPVTPSGRGALTYSTNLNPRTSFLKEKITAGSRASKYMSMTAKQLNSRHTTSNSPTRSTGELEIPGIMYSSSSHSSPTRASGSPLTTPKPLANGRVSGIGAGMPTSSKSRPSLNTPRPRIPSAIAMPPPASPISIRSASTGEVFIAGDSAAEPAASALNLESHDKILLTSGKTTPSVSSPRSESATSFRSSTTDERNLIDQLQSRIDALEYDNERLRSASSVPRNGNSDDVQPQVVEQERDEAVRRIAQLEAELFASENALQAQRTHFSSLEQDYRRISLEFGTLQHNRNSHLEELQKKVDDNAALVKMLEDAVDCQTTIADQQETICKKKEIEMATLELKLEKAYAELRDEKNELGAQIQELRMAGQV